MKGRNRLTSGIKSGIRKGKSEEAFRMKRKGQVRFFGFGFYYVFRSGSVRLIQTT
jgi:hypothetical protein